MIKPIDFKERDQRIINTAETLGTFEIDLTGDRLSVTISREGKELIEYLKNEYGIEYGDPRIAFCG